jgi:hypothetical protein
VLNEYVKIGMFPVPQPRMYCNVSVNDSFCIYFVTLWGTLLPRFKWSLQNVSELDSSEFSYCTRDQDMSIETTHNSREKHLDEPHPC